MPRLRPPGTFLGQPLLRLPVLGLSYLALWLAAELLTFGLMVYLIGLTGTVLLCVLTTLTGFASLRRMGQTAGARLRRAFSWRSGGEARLSREAVLDSSLEGLGAILLILPGFVSDFAGLALAAPSFRLWVTERLKMSDAARLADARSRGPLLIELAPEEWSRSGPEPPL
jgi:UPF0716 protein FxsA